MVSTCFCCWSFLAIALFINLATAQTKTKRQIFREQVLPHRGGKIPEDAFRVDRLALNRLNKEGIAIPDGVLLEHRSVHSHPHYQKYDPEDEDSIIKVVQQSEQRYVPDEGQYHNERPLTVASTYLIRKPIGHEETKIRTPDQQQPLHQQILNKQRGGYRPDYHFKQHPSPPPHAPPPPTHTRYPTHTYDDTEPQVYHPIPVPFVLPNKEIQQDDYFSRPLSPITNNNNNNYASNNFDWQFLYDEPDRFSTNHIQPDFDYPFFGSYHHQGAFPNFDRFASFFGDRFVRKSAEGHVKGVEKNVKPTSRTFYKRVSQIKCNNNDATNKCQVY